MDLATERKRAVTMRAITRLANLVRYLPADSALATVLHTRAPETSSGVPGPTVSSDDLAASRPHLFAVPEDAGVGD